MPLICIIENDPKTMKDLVDCLGPVAPEFKADIKSFKSFEEIEKYKTTEEFQTNSVQLLIVNLDLIKPPYETSLQLLKNNYKTDLILTSFDDPMKPLKNIDKWPVQNIIYKPFDLAILKEHTRFALIKDQMAKTVAVHSSKEKSAIEKIRKLKVHAMSDFGFQFTSDSDFFVGHAYKFYHPVFLDKKKQHIWARVVAKNDKTYDLVFCYMQVPITAQVRKRISSVTAKLKNVKWSADITKIPPVKVKVTLQMTNPEDNDKLKDFFSRKYPEIEVVVAPAQLDSQKLQSDVFISDIEYDIKKFEAVFPRRPIYFRMGEAYRNREHAIQMLAFETARFVGPIDRPLMGKIIHAYFPFLKEVDPNPVPWISIDDLAFLQTDMIEVEQLSEAALTYDRGSKLELGSFQEFTVPQEDETDLTLMTGRVQFVDPNQTGEKLWKHQIVFYGVRDSMLKLIRLWMLQMHIQKQQKG